MNAFYQIKSMPCVDVLEKMGLIIAILNFVVLEIWLSA